MPRRPSAHNSSSMRWTRCCASVRGLMIDIANPVFDGLWRQTGALEAGQVLNCNLGFVDTLNELVHNNDALPPGSRGMPTLFLNDVHIATNVRIRGVGRAPAPARRPIYGAACLIGANAGWIAPLPSTTGTCPAVNRGPMTRIIASAGCMPASRQGETKPAGRPDRPVATDRGGRHGAARSRRDLPAARTDGRNHRCGGAGRCTGAYQWRRQRGLISGRWRIRPGTATGRCGCNRACFRRSR